MIAGNIHKGRTKIMDMYQELCKVCPIKEDCRRFIYPQSGDCVRLLQKNLVDIFAVLRSP